MLGQNDFASGAKPACFGFSSFDFNLQGHILGTDGVALRVKKMGTTCCSKIST